MTPQDWHENDARREESRQRVDNPYGQPVSENARRSGTWIVGAILVAVVVYAVVRWIGVL